MALSALVVLSAAKFASVAAIRPTASGHDSRGLKMEEVYGPMLDSFDGAYGDWGYGGDFDGWYGGYGDGDVDAFPELPGLRDVFDGPMDPGEPMSEEPEEPEERMPGDVRMESGDDDDGFGPETEMDSGCPPKGFCKKGEKYRVCVDGEESIFGNIGGDMPSGVKVTRGGKCEWSEFAGGFDGYFSTEIGDTHEIGMATAAKEMLGDSAARVEAGLGLPENEKVNGFMEELRDLALKYGLRDLELEEHRELADNGERMANIGRVNRACGELIFVEDC